MIKKVSENLTRMMSEQTQISQAQEPLIKLESLLAVRALLLILGAVEWAPWPPKDYSRLLEGGLAKTYSHR